MLTKTENEVYDISNACLLLQPVELPEEDLDDRVLFLAQLKRSKNILYEVFAKMPLNSFTTRLDFKTWYSYTNVFAIDRGFLDAPPEGYVCRPIILKDLSGEHDGLYRGFVWVFYKEDCPFLGMIGIRASLANLLPKKGGVASRLLDQVLSFATEKGKTHVIVPHPLWAMRDILKRRGFHEVQAEYKTPEVAFIEPVCKHSTYYIKPVPSA